MPLSEKGARTPGVERTGGTATWDQFPGWCSRVYLTDLCSHEVGLTSHMYLLNPSDPWQQVQGTAFTSFLLCADRNLSHCLSALP
jgi:hypothetical protein